MTDATAGRGGVGIRLYTTGGETRTRVAAINCFGGIVPLLSRMTWCPGAKAADIEEKAAGNRVLRSLFPDGETTWRSGRESHAIRCRTGNYAHAGGVQPSCRRSGRAL